MQGAFVAQIEDQTYKIFAIRNEFATRNHLLNFGLVRPFDSHHFLGLQGDRVGIDVAFQQINVTKTLGPMNGQGRSQIGKGNLKSQFLTHFALCRLATALACNGTAACGHIPKTGPAEFVELTSLKTLAGIDKEEDIISPDILAPIQVLKTAHLGNHNPRLHTDEVLIALAITAVNSPSAARAMQQIAALKNAEVHSTVILSEVDSSTFRKLGIQLSCEPKYQTKKLFHR